MNEINKIKYKLDTLQSFKTRLASNLNTTIDYLYFNTSLTSIKDVNDDSKVENLIDLIVNPSSSLINIIKTIKLKMGSNYNIEHILAIWFYHNEKIKLDEDVARMFEIERIIQEINKEFTLTLDKNQWTWEYITKIHKKIQDNIKANKKFVKHVDKVIIDFEKTEHIQYTKFIPYTISYKIILTKTLSLMELFNKARVTPVIPYVFIHTFHKILKNYIIPSDWIESDQPTLIVKICNDKNDTNVKNYHTLVIKQDDYHNLYTEITINNLKQTDQKFTITDYINELKKCFQFNKKLKYTESNFTGIYYVHDFNFNKYIFSDLVLNDDLFSDLITIDEHTTATKKTENIRIKFKHDAIDEISATLTPNLIIVGTEQKLFLRIKIKKATSLQYIILFQDFMATLLKIYENNYDTIYNIYTHYIKNFNVYLKETIDDKLSKDYKKYAPEIFINLYSRECCSPQRLPSIIMKPDDFKTNTTQIMKYPRDKQSLDKNQYEGDGTNQLYYTCENDKKYKYLIYKNPDPYHYIGLVKNKKLSNVDSYPYVPCCFKRNQLGSRKYTTYFEGKTSKSTDNKQQLLLKTNKILTYGKSGKLPLNLDKLFNVFYASKQYKYVRKGLYRTKHSFLNCILEAMSDITSYDFNAEECESFLIDTRTKLATLKNVSLCKQELYDKTSVEILTMLQNTDEYLNPRFFLHLLEDYYKCNIFLFSDSNNGSFILPRYVESYYKFNNTYPSVFVYENTNTSSYPQCELIIKYSITDETNIFLQFNLKIAKQIQSIFTKMIQSYTLKTKIVTVDFQIPSDFKLVSQFIDLCGKTRVLHYKYNQSTFSFITNPIQPLRIKEQTTFTYFPIKYKTIKKILHKFSIPILYQTILHNQTIELHILIGNINITIPIIASKQLSTIPILPSDVHYTHLYNINTSSSSMLTLYSTNKHLASYLTEYTFWLFSSYLHTNHIKIVTDKIILDFVRQNYIILPDYVYDKIYMKFSLTSSFFQDNKIIVHSSEILKRLIYCIQLSLYNDQQTLLNYYKHTYITNYFLDVTDFISYPTQIILNGSSAVEYYIDTIHPLLTNKITFTTDPYFFKNSLIDNHIYLAQNTSSLNQAFTILKNWYTKKYNIGLDTPNILTNYSFSLYSYTNETTIVKYSIIGKKSTFIFKIIGYKIETVVHYTVLLSL